MKASSGGAGSKALWRRTTPTSGSSGTVSAAGLVPLPLSETRMKRFKWMALRWLRNIAVVVKEPALAPENVC